jgi:hypothetical protein
MNLQAPDVPHIDAWSAPDGSTSIKQDIRFTPSNNGEYWSTSCITKRRRKAFNPRGREAVAVAVAAAIERVAGAYIICRIWRTAVCALEIFGRLLSKKLTGCSAILVSLARVASKAIIVSPYHKDFALRGPPQFALTPLVCVPPFNCLHSG